MAIVSRSPFTATDVHHRCGKEDCRHIEVALDVGGDPILLDNLYIPAGGDVPDPTRTWFAPAKLDFYREMAGWFSQRKPAPDDREAGAASPSAISTWRRSEHDVWSPGSSRRGVAYADQVGCSAA